MNDLHLQCRINGSQPTYAVKDKYSSQNKWNYHFQLYGTLSFENIGTQEIQILSYSTKEEEWNKEELQTAFNNAFTHFDTIVKKDIPFNIFKPVMIDIDKPIFRTSNKNEFTIDIPSDTDIYKQIKDGIIKIYDAKTQFNKCKEVIRTILDYGPSSLQQYFFQLRQLLDYMFNIIKSGLAPAYAQEKLATVQNAIHFLKERKDTHHANYQSNLRIANDALYAVTFPHIFISEFSVQDIDNTLNELS